MRTQLVSLLTTAAVVLHVLLGCCAHHSHAHSHLVETEAPTNSACHCNHGCATPEATDGESAPGDESGDPAHRQDEPCSDPECQFVAVPRCDDVKQVLSLPVWLPMLESVDSSTGLCGLMSKQVADGPPVHSGGAVVRAATQVWLL